MEKEVNFGKLLHGGDYNPEQWLDYPEILEQDLAYFKKARINEISLGMFSWAFLEPEEGVFRLEWLKEVIDRLYENEIVVMLSTPTAARPRWMAEKYPEVLRVNAARERNLYGERHNHCYTSPVYREKTRIINTKLAEMFKDHPGVIAWHISNEYGGECHCPLCQEAFRGWVKKKYGTLERLNRAWNTGFWSHTYQSFDQVESPSPKGDSSLHGLNLDWKRFVTDQTADFVKWEIKALRDAGAEQPSTINMMYNFTGLNYYKFADVIDFVSWDNYPTWHKEAETVTAMDTGMQHDIMRSIQKKPFYLMESCPSATNWQSVSKLKKPGMLQAASLQAVAHGSDSVLYFQMRQSRGASEKFHGAVIDHYGGSDTRVFREVTKVGAALEKLQEVNGSQNPAEAAVIYDVENRWAVEDAAGPRNAGVFYKETVEKPYQAFRKLGINVEVIDETCSLDGYRVVAAPMVYLLREGWTEKVRNFVKNGGIFLLTYWSGIVDETDLCYLGGTPHDLMDVMGFRSMEIDGLYDGEWNEGIPEPENPLHLELAYRCSHLCELVQPSTAEVVMTYGKDFYDGMPAMTRNVYGKGKAYAVCADFEQGLYDEVCRKLAEEAGVERIVEEVPEGVEVTMRKQKDGTRYVFVQNFNREAVAVKLPIERYPVWQGTYDGTIGSWKTIVLKGR